MAISKRAKVLKAISRLVPRRLMATSFSLKQSTLDIIEAVWNIAKHKKPIFRRGLTVENYKVGSVLCELLYKNPDQKKKVIFFLHAGSYLSGTVSSARNQSMRYPCNTSAALFVVDYRTSPVAPFPAALDDAFAAYKFLQELLPEAEIIFLGDSAGGGLAVSTCLKALEEGVSPPKKVILNSPWTDLSCSSESYFNRQKIDVVLQREFLKKCVKIYAGTNVTNEFVSPVFADLKGFPPLFINVGTDEILLDDSVRLAEN
ncbi:MAG: alpha/beta hydrolase fold domain-containing protein, partial [Oscillospiraceae bacterium]